MSIYLDSQRSCRLASALFEWKPIPVVTWLPVFAPYAGNSAPTSLALLPHPTHSILDIFGQAFLELRHLEIFTMSATDQDLLDPRTSVKDVNASSLPSPALEPATEWKEPNGALPLHNAGQQYPHGIRLFLVVSALLLSMFLVMPRPTICTAGLEITANKFLQIALDMVCILRMVSVLVASYSSCSLGKHNQSC